MAGWLIRSADRFIVEALSPQHLPDNEAEPETLSQAGPMRDTLRGPDTEPRPTQAPVTPANQPPTTAVESEPARGQSDPSMLLADVGQTDFPEAQV